MRGRPGLIFKRGHPGSGWVYPGRHSHHAIALRKRDQLETVVDIVIDRLVAKGFEITSDGKLQKRSTPLWPATKQ